MTQPSAPFNDMHTRLKPFGEAYVGGGPYAFVASAKQTGKGFQDPVFEVLDQDDKHPQQVKRTIEQQDFVDTNTKTMTDALMGAFQILREMIDEAHPDLARTQKTLALSLEINRTCMLSIMLDELVLLESSFCDDTSLKISAEDLTQIYIDELT